MRYLNLTQSLLVVDAETGSDCDLVAEGMYRYWADTSTRTLMTGLGWLDQEHVVLFDHESLGEQISGPMLAAIQAPREQCMLAAANCEFDRRALAWLGLPTPRDKWIDILECAYFLGFSGRTNDVLREVFDDIEKDPEGTRCINTFSKLQNGVSWHDDVLLWEKFRAYCMKDVEVERRLLRWCLQWLNQDWFRPLFAPIYRQSLIYRRVNERGLPIDGAAVNGAIKIRDDVEAEIMAELRELTGLDNPNSRDQMLGWLREQGSEIQDLKKDTVRDEIEFQEAHLGSFGG